MGSHGHGPGHDTRWTPVLGAALLLLTVAGPGAPVLAEADEQLTLTSMIVFFDALPRSLGPGDAFEGATVVDVNRRIHHAVVVTDDPEAFRSRATAREGVTGVEQDLVLVWDAFVPNDPRWADQYGPQLVRAHEAWDEGLGDADAVICIVDSGMRHTHQDLTGARYLDGYDEVNNDNDPWDDRGHGTHVAGIAAASTHNGLGVAGIGQVGMLISKVLNQLGQGSLSNIADGITWCVDNGAHVINMSLGAQGISSTAMNNAMNYADANDILVVAAAGNDGPCSNCVAYPASYSVAMAVTCVTSSESQCGFSSDGPQSEVTAPGSNVLSTCYESNSAYCSKSGTSMSSPHAAGVATLIRSLRTKASADEVRQVLKDTAKDLGPSGYDQQYGYGLVQARAALDAIPPDDAPGPLEHVVFEDLDDGTANGFSLGGLWHVDDQCTTPPSTPNYLGYHRSGTCDYNQGLTGNEGFATFSASLAGAEWAELSFDHRWQTESNSGAYEIMTVQVREAGGAWSTLWRADSSDPNQLAWTSHAESLNGYLGSNIEVRFGFDTVDGVSNGFPGWFIDNVAVGIVTNYAPVARAGFDQTLGDSDGDGEESVALDGSASSDPDGTISSFTWREGTATLATGATPTVTLPVGTHTLTLEVIDNEGANATDDVTVMIATNQAPVADAGVDRSEADHDGDGQGTIALDGTGSGDADGTLTSYEWTEGGSPLASGITPTVTLAQGTHTIELTVTDDGGLTANDAVSIMITPNEPPAADASAACTGRTCTFDGTGSSDSGGIVSYDWTFGDGVEGTGASVEHTYELDGSYTATLTVTDAAGASDVQDVIVDVSGSVQFSDDFNDGFVDVGRWDQVVNAIEDNGCGAVSSPYALRFRGSGARSATTVPLSITGQGTVSFHLRIGTGGSPCENADSGEDVALDYNTGSGWTNFALYDSEAYPSFTLVEVTLPEQALSGSTQLRWRQVTHSGTCCDHWAIDDVTILGGGLHADAGADQTVGDGDGSGAESVTLDATASGAGETPIVTYEWHEDATLLATGVTPTVDLAVGTHTITLTVTDQASKTDTDDVTITVAANQVPTASAGPDQVLRDTDGTGEESASLDGLASSDSDGTLVSYTWREGGATLATGPAPSVSLGVGLHTIELEVTDNGGLIDTDQLVVDVRANQPPVAVAGSDQEHSDHDGDGSEPVTLDGTLSSDPDGTLVSLTWSEGGATVATGANPTVALAVGTHTLTLVATDDGGATASDDVVITVLANVAPTADAGPDQEHIDVNGDGVHEVSFDGTASSDPDGVLASFTWRLDGATLATGPTPSAAVPVGTHEITLEVVDDGGALASDTLMVVVIDNQPPVAEAGADQLTSDADDDGTEPITLDGTASSDPDGTIVAYTWVSDGATLATGPSPTVALPVGLHTITLTVTDDGGASATDTVVVEIVDNFAPSAAFDVSCEGLVCVFDAGASSDPDGVVVAHAWTFGDGAQASGPSVTHTYAGPGTPAVSLEVTDEDGASDALAKAVEVRYLTGLEQDFDGPIHGWTTADDGGPASWTTTTLRRTSAPNAMALRNYGAFEEDVLVSPPVDLTAVEHPLLSFTAWIDGDATCLSGCAVHDALDVEVSTDEGVSWDPLWTDLWATNGVWEEYALALDHLAGSVVQLRFRVTSDELLSGDGFYVDDVRLEDQGASAGTPLLVATDPARDDAGTSGLDLPQLDLRRLEATRDAGGSVVFDLTVRSLQAIEPPPSEGAPAAAWRVVWQDGGTERFAELMAGIRNRACRVGHTTSSGFVVDANALCTASLGTPGTVSIYLSAGTANSVGLAAPATLDALRAETLLVYGVPPESPLLVGTGATWTVDEATPGTLVLGDEPAGERLEGPPVSLQVAAPGGRGS